MSTPTPTQQAVTAGTNPQGYPDPTQQARAISLPHDREGQIMGVTKIRQAEGREYRQTTFDCNGANAAITLTGDMILGGNIKVINAGVGAVTVNLPTAPALAAALSAYWSIHPAPAAPTPQPAAPSSNPPGSWLREIRFSLENISGQSLTITDSASITAAGMGSATVLTATRATVAIRGSVDPLATLAYVWIRQ